VLSPKHWKLEAIMRLVVGVFICMTAGSLFASLLHYTDTGGRPGWKLRLVVVGAFGFLGATLAQLRKSWTLENLTRRLWALLFCLYAGFFLSFWGEKLLGPPFTEPSVQQLIIGVLSFQGAGLFLTVRFLREHRMSWREAFGFSHEWLHAVLVGVIFACLFLPIAKGLQIGALALIEELMKHLPQLALKPEEQQAVQALRSATSWVSRIVSGAVTVVVAPVAEEVLFRGILYPSIKQVGFPRLAFWGTALLFAGIHVNSVSFLPLFILALGLAVLYERTDNLLAPVAAHSAFNALNLAMLYVLERRAG
jgi:membrane protease YdiL (CAAX protease family)